MTPTRRWTMKAILVAVVLAGCAFAFAIGTASAD